MDNLKKPSRKNWIIVHILFPLLPFFLHGFIRFISSGFIINLATFNASTLSMSIALLCIFVNQSILCASFPIYENDQKEDLYSSATLFMFLAAVNFSLFAVLVLLHSLRDFYDFDVMLVIKYFRIIIFPYSILPIYLAIRAQLSFKLRTII